MKLTDDALSDRFDRYGALYIVCADSHGGQWSRGYRLLSRLIQRGYSPGLSVQHGEPESEAMTDYIDRYRAAAACCAAF